MLWTVIVALAVRRALLEGQGHNRAKAIQLMTLHQYICELVKANDKEC